MFTNVVAICPYLIVLKVHHWGGLELFDLETWVTKTQNFCFELNHCD